MIALEWAVEPFGLLSLVGLGQSLIHDRLSCGILKSEHIGNPLSRLRRISFRE